MRGTENGKLEGDGRSLLLTRAETCLPQAEECLREEDRRAAIGRFVDLVTEGEGKGNSPSLRQGHQVSAKGNRKG